MSNVKYVDGIIKDVIEKQVKEINEAEALRKAWASVEFPTKKDGTEFQSLAKNFTNCTLNTKSYAMFNFEKGISVFARTHDGSPVYDSIDTYDALNRHIKNERAEAHPERVIKPSQYLVPFYVKSVEDLRADIMNKTVYWAKVANDKKQMLITFEKETKDLVDKIGDLFTEFEEKNGKRMASLAKDTIRENFIMFN